MLIIAKYICGGDQLSYMPLQLNKACFSCFEEVYPLSMINRHCILNVVWLKWKLGALTHSETVLVKPYHDVFYQDVYVRLLF